MKTPRHPLRRRLALASALVAALLAVPSAASAGVPVIVSVGQSQHHATVAWTLPAGTASRGVEISDSPAVASDGTFFSDHVKSSDSVSDAQTTYLSSQLLQPGTYYVHVAGYVPGCDTCPSAEWSALVPLVIPTFVQPIVQGSGQVTGPGGLTCAGVTCTAADVPADPTKEPQAAAFAGRIFDKSESGNFANVVGQSYAVRALTRTNVVRGAVVVICSDGLDVGDPEVLHAEMARLARLAHRVVWLNPLKEDPAYEPLARGMRQALPHVDLFLSGHNLASLEGVGEAL